MGLFDRFKKRGAPQVETKLVPGVGRVPYPAYRGKEPYIFVSYAHADSGRVFPEIERFNKLGYHVWYDEGISPGNEWTDDIAQALAGCTVFVAMITPVSAPRENVLNEIDFAIDEKKPFILVHLERTVLPKGLRLRTSRKQAVLKYQMSEDEYVYKLTEAFSSFGLRRTKVAIEPHWGHEVPITMSEHVTQVTEPVAPTETVPPAQVQSTSSATVNRAASSTTPYELTVEQRLNIERVKNSEVTERDFEWMGTAIKAYHGIKRRVNIPQRATKIMTEAFRGKSPMEYVKIPETVTELDYASFCNCSDLTQAVIENRQIRINNADELGAFVNCGKLTVFCYKDSETYAELRRTHMGEIRFIEESSDATQAAQKPEAAPMPQTPAAVSNPHPWGSYEPKGTAYIETNDGKRYQAVANSLILKAIGIDPRRTTGFYLYQGLDNACAENPLRSSYALENMIYFCDMKAVERTDEGLEVTNYDDETSLIKLPYGAELWFIGEEDGILPSSVMGKDIARISFDRTRTPSVRIRYCKIDTKRGSFLAPVSFLWFYINYQMRSSIPSMKLVKELTKFASSPLPLKRIKRMVVTKSGTNGSPFSLPEPMDMAVYLKNGEEYNFTTDPRFSIFAMSERGVIRTLLNSELQEIVILT